MAKIPLPLPRRRNDKHSPESGHCDLLVRLADPSPQDPSNLDSTLAAFRGPGMVVKYHIVDPAGNVRGMFFYKAAFYDRSAHLCAPLARFEIRTDYDRTKAIDYKGDAFEVFDRVCNTVIFSTELVRYAEGMGWAERDVLRERALNEARDWLDERFPDWERPFTYWDSP